MLVDITDEECVVIRECIAYVKNSPIGLEAIKEDLDIDDLAEGELENIVKELERKI